MIDWGESALFTLILLSCLQSVCLLLLPQRYSGRFSLALFKGARVSQVFQFFLALIMFATLIYAYVVSDLSVVNVALNSRQEAPLIYKITGVWGNHEGSMILWLFILVGYSAAFAMYSRLPKQLTTKVLGLQGGIIALFSLFVFATSNPFLRVKTPYLRGQDLNPILQDPALAFHPPTLYMGLVGFSLVFSLTLAALARPQGHGNLEGITRSAWIQEARLWALIAWSFLTLGITMGSWWAYYELGWGGWWFWDPVENASLMPWLSATALLHMLKATEKQPQFIWRTYGLALSTFLLCLLGTFLVRSGALSSVHAFASDPTRGLFLGSIFGGLSLISFVILGRGWYQFRSQPAGLPAPHVPLSSRLGLLGLNSQILLLIAFIVVLGTCYPLLIEGITGDTMTVGAPYFIATCVPLSFPLLFLMGLSGALPWQKPFSFSSLEGLKLQARLALPFTILLGSLVFMMASDMKGWRAMITLSLSLWIITATLKTFWHTARRADAHSGQKSWGMMLSHLGFGIALLGMGVDTLGMQEKLAAVQVGETFTFKSYTFHLKAIEHAVLPTYEVERARLILEKNNYNKELTPEKRYYPLHQSMTTETALHHFWFSNIYVALGGYLPAEDRWTLRIYYHPLVELIWLGGILMAVGGLIALNLSHRVYRFFVRNKTMLVFLLCGQMLIEVPVQAVEIHEQLKDPVLEARARQLSADIKCPICAGQSIDDSNVPLAKTLRQWVRAQIQAGERDEDIRKALMKTYGESILFRPVLNLQNSLLWGLPVLMILGIGLSIFKRSRLK